MGSGV
ncbi:hypothetical protein STRIP9103_01477, partial [Streptomyces ipomoeae 91-03]|jgi:hypothetical protein